MPPRKTYNPIITLENGPPGPIQFEIRANGKPVFIQRVHDYTIDQDDQNVTITAIVRKTTETTPTPERAADQNQ